MNKNSGKAPKKNTPFYQMATGAFANKRHEDKRYKREKHKQAVRDMY